MRITILVEAAFDDGGLAWGYNLNEIVPVADGREVRQEIAKSRARGDDAIPPEVVEALREADREAAGSAFQLVLDRMDEARASIVSQVQAEMPNLANEGERE